MKVPKKANRGCADLIWMLLPMVVIVVVVILLVASSGGQYYGTSDEEYLLMTKVKELQASGFTVERQSMGFWSKFQTTTRIYNFTDFGTFLHNHSIQKCYYTFEGTLGPKLWMELNGTLYYWRAD